MLSLLTKPVAKCSQPPRASPWRRGIVGALGVLGVVDDRVEVDVGEEPADGESSFICASVVPHVVSLVASHFRSAARLYSFGVARRPASLHSYAPSTILSIVRTPSSIASRFAPRPSPRIM